MALAARERRPTRRGGRTLWQFVALLACAAILAGACSSSDEGASGEASGVSTPDSFCDAWGVMEAVIESDEPPDEAALNAYLDARGVARDQAPDELDEAFDDLLEWDDRFIEIIYAVDFQWEEVTEELIVQAFGSTEEVEAAETAQQSAITGIQRYARANCKTTAGDTASFCDQWDDMYWLATIESPDQRDFPGEFMEMGDPSDAEQRLSFLVDRVDQADPSVPAEIQGDWDAFAGYQIGRYDLLVTVGFDEDLLSDELLAESFGSAAAFADAETAAAEAVDAIESWTWTGCGDFSARGQQLLEGGFAAFAQESLGWVRAEPFGLTYSRRAGDILDVLVPDELRESWTYLSTVLHDWASLWESVGFDGGQIFPPSPEVQTRAVDLLAGQIGLFPDERAVEIFAQDLAERFGTDPNELGPEERTGLEAWVLRGDFDAMPEWMQAQVAELATGPPGRPSVGDSFGTINRWFDQNCGDVARPGNVTVLLPEITGGAGDWLVAWLGERGATFDDIGTPGVFVRGGCRNIDRDPFGVIYEEGRFRRPDELQVIAILPQELDNAIHCEFRGGDRVEPGDYTLLVARHDDLPARADQVGTPTHCTTADVTVAGDIQVELRDLPDCDIDRVPLEPDDWRYSEPVDPSTPGAGTLKIRYPSMYPPEQVDAFEGAELRLVVLPAGTSINEVGREQVFPAGIAFVCLAGGILDDPNRDRPMDIPIGPMPLSSRPSCLNAFWLSGSEPQPGLPRGRPPVDAVLPLRLLPPGQYDVRLEIEAFRGGDDPFERSCIRFPATVQGDTVVEFPGFETGEPCT